MTEQAKITGFRIHEEIARGGMAIVYRATQSALERSVAIKVLQPEIVQRNPEFISRFQQEAQAIAGLTHPYILPVYDYGSTDAFTYIVMQYIPNGTTLRDYRSTNSGESNWLRIVEIGCQIADALTHAHSRRIIHCDLKPSNILWHEERPLLADFGLAQLEHEAPQYGDQQIMGTPAYMAPEQFKRQPLDSRTDIYALGLILYQLLTGILPHTASTIEQIATNRGTLPPAPSRHNPDLPTMLDTVLLRALAVDPQNRFASMSDFRSELEAVSGKRRHHPSSTEREDPVNLSAKNTTLLSPPDLTPFQAPLQVPHFVDHVEQRSQILEAVSVGSGPKFFGLVGLGGSGKTALATQVTHEMRDYFPDGVLWTQLDATTPSAALLSFGNSFGQWERIAEAPDLLSKATAVRQILAHKRVLVVLDNVDDSAQLEYLLPTGPYSASLITTRNRKLLSPINAEIIDVEPLARADSVALLENMLGAERVHAEIESAYEIIDLVGGLPLALDIVAGYLSEADDLLIAEYKSALLDERQRLENLADWEDTSKDVVASFELSYSKLPPNLQQVFAGLSIFYGRDFSPEAVSGIFSMPLPIVKSTLGRMKSLSLLTTATPEKQSDNHASGQGKAKSVRYNLHPLLKLFASSKLSADKDDLNRCMLDYYAQLIEACKQGGYPLLAQEWENIHGVLQWAAQNECWAEFTQSVLGLTEPTVGIMGFLDAYGHWSDAAEMLELALQQFDANRPMMVQAKFLLRAGVYDLKRGEPERSHKCFDTVQKLIETDLQKADLAEDDAIDLARNSAYMYESMARIVGRTDREAALEWLTRGIGALKAVSEGQLASELGYLHIQLASAFGRLGRIEQADEAAKKGLEMLPAAPSPAKVGGLINLAHIASRRGNANQCIDYIEEGIKLATTIGDFRRLALLWLNLGAEQEQLGQYTDARNSYDTALHLYQKMGHEDEGYVHSNLGLTYTILGQGEFARGHLMKAIEFAEQLKLEELICFAKINLARLQIHDESPQQALDNLNHANQVCEALQLTYLLIEIRRLQAEAMLRLGAVDDSLKLIEKSIDHATDTEQPLESGISWRVKGAILKASADVDGAHVAYEISLGLIDNQDPYEKACTQLAMAQLHFEKQPSTFAHIKNLLNEALNTFELLGTQREILAVDELLNQLESGE